MDIETILAYDKEHIWHPYSSMSDPLPVYPVKEARGCLITLQNEIVLVDGMSSWWAVIHGYNHPKLNSAISEQLKKIAHVMFGGFTHEPAVSLTRKLVDLTPKELEKVFFCDSGSVSVEVALKMALQYWHALKHPNKNQFASIKSGYHGDTWNAMSVSDPVTGMHRMFHGNLPIHYFADQPKIRFGEKWDEKDAVSLIDILEKNHETLAAVILEPIVQGAGGMWFYSPNYLKAIRKACTKYDVLLICDEIATGFGRTGKLFACEHANVSPDILCLGKAITGGYMSFAATMTTGKISNVISQGEPGVFMHGPTFMGNPLACAVANASIDLLISSNWKEKVLRIQEQLKLQLSPCQELGQVKDIRVLGAIGVVELYHPVDLASIQKRFVQEGVWIRPFGKLVYVMPPYIISSSELSQLTTAIYAVLKNL
ncbi:adenosylmethionine--8-amino-7-oxononanoate transaminase [Arenibacter sp. F20364]|uniref:adenosylmethionine--8-amino-7-oxononanoate transaminase n=1 Tax=Arenibacter sp. F20364 TaxID=2926415 RepID=UPI001FF4B5EA|nr:adenosylmethionine--8-amino-7-oxononanoate transaminase [Arenibacter sp. F20364]MCK0192918.1 adenosylmethionine--8-amino-7-oxononanoate transaminase [Arenibacter sp. F20364]|tara:strand:- start:5749 stop:7029 length:1281 start_codon:yes stop_codon:yes gene_type:complete